MKLIFSSVVCSIKGRYADLQSVIYIIKYNDICIYAIYYLLVIEIIFENN